ncbi:MAG: hypothetical protein OEM83_00230, partial [Gammaproteobacteria bacterium]|nr:hypothetical protein [Gammaproteobacteria bacterium]
TIFIALLWVAMPTQAAVIRMDFSGNVTWVQQNPNVGWGTSGSFNGVLIADWDTGEVSQFDATVHWNNGNSDYFSIAPNWDFINVTLGNTARYYWSDGTTNQYTLSSGAEGIQVFRGARDQNGNFSPVPDNEWTMLLEANPDGWFDRWIWGDDHAVTVPCSSPSGYCWEYVEEYNIYGDVTSLTVTSVPLPPGILLLVSGLLGLATTGRWKSAVT